MAVKEDICNVALGKAKQDATIVNFEEDTVPGKRCRRFYDSERKKALQMFPWPFAQQEVFLASKDVESTAGYGFVYSFPANALSVRTVAPAGLPVCDFSTANKFNVYLAADGLTKEIHTNIEKAKAQITVDVENATLFTALFADLHSAMIAVQIGKLYQLSRQDMADLQQDLAITKQMAEEAFANDTNVTFDACNPYVEARGT